jgi:hypothetical protein
MAICSAAYNWYRLLAMTVSMDGSICMVKNELTDSGFNGKTITLVCFSGLNPPITSPPTITHDLQAAFSLNLFMCPGKLQDVCQHFKNSSNCDKSSDCSLFSNSVSNPVSPTAVSIWQ